MTGQAASASAAGARRGILKRFSVDADGSSRDRTLSTSAAAIAAAVERDGGAAATPSTQQQQQQQQSEPAHHGSHGGMLSSLPTMPHSRSAKTRNNTAANVSIPAPPSTPSPGDHTVSLAGGADGSSTSLSKKDEKRLAKAERKRQKSAQDRSWSNEENVARLQRDRQARERGLEFHQPGGWTLTWEKIKRKLLLASTGTPSSGGNPSVTSEASRHSREAAYLRNDGAGAGAAHHGGGEKQVHMALNGYDPDGNPYGDDDWKVDQVVVDAEFFDADGNIVHNGTSIVGSGDHCRQDGRMGAGYGRGPHHPHSSSGRDGGTTTAHSDTAGSLMKAPGFAIADGIFTFFAGWLYPKCKYFFEPRFGDEEKEENFRKERWYNTKRHAFFGCVFMIINWALICGLVTMYSKWQSALYYGVHTAFLLPLPFMVAFDFPRKRPMIYSIVGAAATSCLGYFSVISMYECHFLREGRANCSGQTFLLSTYYSAAFSVIGLFALNVNRLCMAIAQIGLCGLVIGTLLMESANYARNFVNLIIFFIFIQYLHYGAEKVDRRMYTLRSQLKTAYKAQQKAQIAEKRAANSKKRFVSYVFHEVRVPLNTAYLGLQNLQASDVFDKSDEDQMVEVYALESSLQQVQQVLNDVLDLQRMDSGRFEFNANPFHFHRTCQALVAGLKVATQAKRLTLNVDLDDRIDNLPQSIRIPGEQGPATFVIGDEIRLRQVLTNLASNSCKFNPEGKGGISFSTRLIYPNEALPADNIAADEGDRIEVRADADGVVVSEKGQTSATHPWQARAVTPVNDTQGPLATSSTGNRTSLTMRSSDERDLERGLVTEKVEAQEKKDEAVAMAHRSVSMHGTATHQSRQPMPGRTDSSSTEDSEQLARRDCVIVRIEISDNGSGISPNDMKDLRVFSAFTQTETGRVQGGKGTGLGLAIVRALVQLANGRLGVKSSSKGTTFWMEFRWPIANASEVAMLHEPVTPMSLAAPTPLPRPLRPGVKPYKAGESSWSQYSAQRLEQASIAAASALGDSRAGGSMPPTPAATAEMAHPMLPLAGAITTPVTGAALAAVDARSSPSALSFGKPSSATPTAQRTAAPSSAVIGVGAYRPSSREARHASGSISVHSAGGSVASGGVTSPPPPAAAALNAIDTTSPLTSEQWTASTERSIFGPPMSVTAPTPPSLSSRTNLSLVASHRTPSPSPPLQDNSSTAKPSSGGTDHRGEFPTSAASAQVFFTSPTVSAPTPPARQERQDSASASSFRGEHQVGDSPIGEAAFTPSAIAQAAAPGTPSPMQELPRTPVPAASVLSKSPLSTATYSDTDPERPLTAFVVDDDPLTRKLMGRMMTRLGCVVEETENGQLFLDVLLGLGNGPDGQPRQPRYFDFVTLDNAMPVLTGEQAIRKLRAQGRTDFVIGATGNALQSDQNAYTAAGADAILTKPISAKDLKHLLGIARKRRTERERLEARARDDPVASSSSPVTPRAVQPPTMPAPTASPAPAPEP